MGSLDRAIAIAVEAHRGQVDKAGEPYILHPLRVMLAVPAGDARIVAVLHDVVEDVEDSERFSRTVWDFEPQIVKAIDAISRRKDETYRGYIDRLSGNELARVVKLADLQDNLRPSRIAAISRDLARRYERAQDVLWGTAPGGGT